MEPSDFSCNDLNYVVHWLVAGPRVALYSGPPSKEDDLRRDAMDQRIVAPPENIAIGRESPIGELWRYHDAQHNLLVEHSVYYPRLSILDMWGATRIVSQADGEIAAGWWISGLGDLWVNGKHVVRDFRLKKPGLVPVRISLKSGVNDIVVRLQALGARGTVAAFGLQLPAEHAGNVRVRLPGSSDRKLLEAIGWLESVAADARHVLQSETNAPAGAYVKWLEDQRAAMEPERSGDAPLAEKEIAWPAGTNRVEIPADVFRATFGVAAADQDLHRVFEWAPRYPAASPAQDDVAAHRKRYLEKIAALESSDGRDVLRVIARRLLGKRGLHDDAIIGAALESVNRRQDVADFLLAMLLRLYMLDLASEDERRRIRETAVAFRYWDDETGSDAMYFLSENHRLLFHGCQRIAGKLFPDDHFTASGRTGREQARIARDRAADWFDKRLTRGLSEFLSGPYMPITTGAIMNIVDFCDDEQISRQGIELLDQIFNAIARFSFDGITLGPQGRVYRQLLYPPLSGTQSMLHYGTPLASERFSPWLVFVHSSQRYRPPADLDQLMRRPAEVRLQQDVLDVHLKKTDDFFISGVQIPASHNTAGLWEPLKPGNPGFQQHLWHASLGRDCHVWVNHPGSAFDLSHSMTGYWSGNGILPAMRSEGNRVIQLFEIPENHPIHFTHAHWPSHAFEQELVEDHWAFGAAGGGFVALWCSEKLVRHDQVLVNQELRAYGRRMAWMCVCDKREDDFEKLIELRRADTPTIEQIASRLNPPAA